MIVLLAGVFTSCDDFFTTSWGKWAARDMSKMDIKVSADNIDDLMDQASNDKDLQVKILDELVDASKKASGKDKQKLQDAGVDLALSSTDIVGTVMDNIGDIESFDSMEDPEEMKKYISGIVNNIDNLQGSTDALLQMIPNDQDSIDAFMAGKEVDTDIALVSVLLIAAEIQNITADDPEKDFEELFEEFNVEEEESINIDDLPAELQTDKIRLALGLLGNGSPLTKLEDMFSGFGE
jgi:hypothetical protein